MAGLSAVFTLDSSPLAEDALALVPFLQQAGLKEIHLVSVSEEHEHSIISHKASQVAAVERLRRYLAGVAKRLESADLSVELSVREGRPAEEVLAAIDDISPDLVVIATHGRTGIERWQLGSVADKVIGSAPCPTLVIGPNVRRKPLQSFVLKRILVPLDGSDVGEKALVVADWLSSFAKAEIELVEVVRLPNTWAAEPMFVPDPGLILDDMEAGATDYLARKLPGRDVKRTVVRTIAGGIALEILGVAREDKADLIVLTSHTRHGLSRAMLGSVADELLRGPAPVLILRGSEPVPANLTAPAARVLNPVG